MMLPVLRLWLSVGVFIAHECSALLAEPRRVALITMLVDDKIIRHRCVLPANEKSLISVVRRKFGLAADTEFRFEKTQHSGPVHHARLLLQIISSSTPPHQYTPHETPSKVLNLSEPRNGAITARTSTAVAFTILKGSMTVSEACEVQIVVDGHLLSKLACQRAQQSMVLEGLSIGDHEVMVRLIDRHTGQTLGDAEKARLHRTYLSDGLQAKRSWPLKCNAKVHVDMPPLSHYTGRPVTILLWGNTVPWWRFVQKLCLECRNPALVLEYTEDCVAEADAIVWGCWGSFAAPPAELLKSPHQVWIYFCMESSRSDPRMLDRKFLAQFDVISTFQMNSSFPRLYTPADPALLLRAPRAKTTEAPLVWVASHCGRHNGQILRDKFVAELMKYITVDAMGRCLHNKEMPLQRVENGSSLIPLYAEYPFTLALHDSSDDDYVDEKFFLPLVAGSIPVFSGARNIRSFAPNPKSYIDVADYATPHDLAKYLLYLMKNATAYNEYLVWKTQPLPPKFLELVKDSIYTGTLYGEAQHHGFPTPTNICDFTREIMMVWTRRSSLKS